MDEQRITVRLSQIDPLIAALLKAKSQANANDPLTDVVLVDKLLTLEVRLATVVHIGDVDIENERLIAEMLPDGIIA